MSEYWKSTPKYWCKYCSVYVRDTPLERANHEATGRHQGALKRSLRTLHREHEREERDKERAKREVDRLNGVVSGAPSSSSPGFRAGAGGNQNAGTRVGAYGAVIGGPKAQVTQVDRHRQLEQLVEMGVAIPDELKGEMAMAGEWTVTSARVVRGEDDGDANEEKPDSAVPTEARAKGVRKRELEKTEEEQEEENAVQKLFKKPKKWGRDSKAMSGQEDEELEALLSGGLPKKVVKEEDEGGVKREENRDGVANDGELKGEPGADELPLTKQESGGDGFADRKPPIGLVDAPGGKADDSVAAVVFKKRKPKAIRQK